MVTLQPADYWRFRALMNERHAIESEAAAAAHEFKQRIADADAKARALFADLGNTYGFDPAKTYRWNDATCELVEAGGRAEAADTATARAI